MNEKACWKDIVAFGGAIMAFVIGAGFATADEVLKTIEVPGAASNWVFSGILYGAFSLVGLMPFIAGMGKQARSSTDTLWGGIFGGVTFLVGGMILSTGLLANIGEVYDKQVPSLVIAGMIYTKYLRKSREEH